MKTPLRSIIYRFKTLSRASVEQDKLDEKAAKLATLARANQPAIESKVRHGFGRAISFLAAMGVVGWIATGAAAATVTVSTLVATNSLPDPIQKFSADVLEIVGIDAPRPKEKIIRNIENPTETKPETKPKDEPETKPK